MKFASLKGSSREQKKEIQQELTRREEERKHENDKKQIDEEIELYEGARKKALETAVEQRKTDPIGAQNTINYGAKIDEGILMLKRNKATLEHEEIMDRIDEAKRREVRRIYLNETRPAKFFTKRQIEKIEEAHTKYIVMSELEKRATEKLMKIYGYGADASGGEGSAFEADVLAAERQAQIDDIDD